MCCSALLEGLRRPYWHLDLRLLACRTVIENISSVGTHQILVLCSERAWKLVHAETPLHRASCTGLVHHWSSPMAALQSLPCLHMWDDGEYPCRISFSSIPWTFSWLSHSPSKSSFSVSHFHRSLGCFSSFFNLLYMLYLSTLNLWLHLLPSYAKESKLCLQLPTPFNLELQILLRSSLPDVSIKRSFTHKLYLKFRRKFS